MDFLLLLAWAGLALMALAVLVQLYQAVLGAVQGMLVRVSALGVAGLASLGKAQTMRAAQAGLG
jgi:hypothetical protein